jgi:hypothetical protein
MRCYTIYLFLTLQRQFTSISFIILIMNENFGIMILLCVQSTISIRQNKRNTSHMHHILSLQHIQAAYAGHHHKRYIYFYDLVRST